MCGRDIGGWYFDNHADIRKSENNLDLLQNSLLDNNPTLSLTTFLAADSSSYIISSNVVSCCLSVCLSSWKIACYLFTNCLLTTFSFCIFKKSAAHKNGFEVLVLYIVLLYISQLFCGKGDSLINGNVIMIIVIMNSCNLTNCVFAGNFPYPHTT